MDDKIAQNGKSTVFISYALICRLPANRLVCAGSQRTKQTEGNFYPLFAERYKILENAK
jgi:hypothetical protein